MGSGDDKKNIVIIINGRDSSVFSKGGVRLLFAIIYCWQTNKIIYCWQSVIVDI